MTNTRRLASATAWNIILTLPALALVLVGMRSPSPAPTEGGQQPYEYALILDIGHGGRDLGSSTAVEPALSIADRHGSSRHAIEHSLAFDVGARIVELARERDRGLVLPTISDADGSLHPSPAAFPDHDGEEVLRLDPPQSLESLGYRPGLHLRWALASRWYRNLREYTTPEELPVFFVSLHIDERDTGHVPVAPGLLFFVMEEPADVYLGSSFEEITRFEEVRDLYREPPPRAARQELSQGTELAMRMQMKARRRDLDVFPMRPLRSQARHHAYAVLRYNEVPTRILLELGDLNDTVDIANLGSVRYRQRLARLLLDAVEEQARRNAMTRS